MKRISLFIFTVTLSHFAWGQTTIVESIPKAKAVDASEEAGRVLNNASAAGRSEAERISLDQSAGKTRLDQAVDKSQSKSDDHSGNVERAMVEDVNRKLDPALSRVAPEGKKLVAQSNAAPALRAPAASIDPAQPVRAKAVGDEAPAPATTKPGKTEGAADSHIDIVCQGALYFDSAQSMAVFTEDVVLTHPQFHLTCDELQVYMLKDSEKPKEPVAVKTATTTEAPKPQQDSSVKQAIATGRKVVIQKRSETGEMQIGISRSATYIGESGDIILRDMPQVQRGRNLIIATDRSTYMILKQNGELKVRGPSRTEIIQEATKKALDTTAAPSAAGVSAPVAKPLPADKPSGTKPIIKKKDKGVKP